MAMLPKLKLKALVSFPSNVYGGTGIDVTKTTGNFTVGLDYSEFARASALPPNTYTLVWDPLTNYYALVPPTATGGIADAPNNGITFGRRNADWVDAWASPALTGTATAPTPSPGDSDNSIATTAFVAAAVLAGSGGSPSNTVPGMDGVGAAGVSALYSRGDHVHPSDTAKQAADADLTAVAALSGTGIARRTATTPTWSVGTAVANAELATMAAFTFKGNNSGGSAVPGDVNIATLTTKASPAGGDFLLVSDQAASGAWKKVAISTMPGSAGGIPEAPNDGQLYGRQSLGWSVVVGGGATPSGALPAMDSVANAGTSLLYSRGDHVHPSDTTKADITYVDTKDALKADIASPVFTGDPKAPTPSPGDNDTSIATTAFVAAALAAGGSVTPAALTKVDETNVTLTLGGTPSLALLQATSITVGWTGTLSTGRGGFGTNVSAANGVPLFNAGVPVFTASTGTGDFVRAADAVLTGNPTAPTPSPGDNDASIATTAFVGTAVSTAVSAAITGVVRYDAVQSLTAPQQAQARANIAVPVANTVINGAFTINQGGYVSGAVLAADAYGHDQWKAGSSGGDYSFTQLKSSTTITIAVGKSLIQPIEDVRVRGGTYVLSWTGTAQARAGVNSLTPSGAYAASPLIISSQTAGTVMSVEFNAGTLGNVSLAEGTVAPPFVVPDYASELALCQRYYEKTNAGLRWNSVLASSIFGYGVVWKVEKRSSPTAVVTAGIRLNVVGVALNNPSIYGVRFTITSAATTGDTYALEELITSTARL